METMKQKNEAYDPVAIVNQMFSLALAIQW